MRRRRTIYFNDARHYYLFVFEPPIRMEEAWVPIDEIAGTAVMLASPAGAYVTGHVLTVDGGVSMN